MEVCTQQLSGSRKFVKMEAAVKIARKGIAGSLVLDVAIKTDGSLLGVQVLRPSGQKVLDAAAVRIVELAAPFAPLPPDIRADVDILHITRTWKFQESGVSSSNE